MRGNRPEFGWLWSILIFNMLVSILASEIWHFGYVHEDRRSTDPTGDTAMKIFFFLTLLEVVVLLVAYVREERERKNKKNEKKNTGG